MAAELGPMAPGQVRELYEAWENRERQMDLRAGVIACSMAGGHPADYFPSLNSLRPDPPTDEELERKLLLAFVGGAGAKG